MPDQQIFCNTPWYELHIYWDGSFGVCCQENHKVYPESQTQTYNVREMSIQQWFNSKPMRDVRVSMFGPAKNSICKRCYLEEAYGSTSRRHRSNQKSVIFTKTAFRESYIQSPHKTKFEHSCTHLGEYDGMPVDLHIDLGNYCNLACKMCSPMASSVIAAQHVKWGKSEAEKYIGTDWTRNQEVWQRTIQEIAGIKSLRNVHFMGGETLISKRFEDFVDFMLLQSRTDLNFSFVTNGTTFNQSLLDKLKKFQQVGIEVSIESMDQRNSYQRQGTDQNLVVNNIKQYLEQCDGSTVTLTLRPAISLLTIGSYAGLLEFSLLHNLVVKGLLVYRPDYLDVRILPDSVKQFYMKSFQDLMHRHRLDEIAITGDYNESDPNQTRLIVKSQIDQCLNILNTPQLPNSDKLLRDLVNWCDKWDRIYGYDALTIYPELQKIFVEHGYSK